MHELARDRVRTVREPPRWFRGQLLKAYCIALDEWSRTQSSAAWKLFLLIPRMLLQPTDERGEEGKAIFQERMRLFLRGDWLALLRPPTNSRAGLLEEMSEEDKEQKRISQAEAKILVSRNFARTCASHIDQFGTRDEGDLGRID